MAAPPRRAVSLVQVLGHHPQVDITNRTTRILNRRNVAHPLAVGFHVSTPVRIRAHEAQATRATHIPAGSVARCRVRPTKVIALRP
jgi:hypothetical protein